MHLNDEPREHSALQLRSGWHRPRPARPELALLVPCLSQSWARIWEAACWLCAYSPWPFLSMQLSGLWSYWTWFIYLFIFWARSFIGKTLNPYWKILKTTYMERYITLLFEPGFKWTVTKWANLSVFSIWIGRETCIEFSGQLIHSFFPLFLASPTKGRSSQAKDQTHAVAGTGAAAATMPDP